MPENEFTYEQARDKGMSWVDVIRCWEPNTTEEEADEILEKMYQRSYQDAVEGRRLFVTEYMIFENIKYVHFRGKEIINNPFKIVP